MPQGTTDKAKAGDRARIDAEKRRKAIERDAQRATKFAADLENDKRVIEEFAKSLGATPEKPLQVIVCRRGRR
jgi:hypothetical protein